MKDAWSGTSIEFARRGYRPDPVEHFQLLSELVTSQPLRLTDEVQTLLGSVSWEGANSEASTALDLLVDICRAVFFSVAAVATTPPPLPLVGIHRQGARQLARFGEALCLYLEALLSPTREAVLEIRTEAQRALDDAGDLASQMSEFMSQTERSLNLPPGWWTTGASYDVGRAMWQGLGATSASVEEAADRVRRALRGVPGINELDDVLAMQLLPAVSMVFYDPVRLVEKARQARTLLDTADCRDARWIRSEEVLARQVLLGQRKLTDQLVQLGFTLRQEAPRAIVLHTATDTYSKLLEGPFRHMGAVLYIASRVARGKRAVYETDSETNTSYATILNHFQNVAADLAEGGHTLLRNAEAHYSFEITDDGIEFRDVHQSGGREDFLGDDDFMEELSATIETLVAFEIALFPYLWTHPSSRIQGALELASRQPAEREAQVRGVAGLKGFTEMSFQEEEDTLRLTARYEGLGENPYMEVLPTLAAVWHLWDYQNAIVSIRDRQPLSLVYERASFSAYSSENRYVRDHSVALIMRDVRLQTETLASDETIDLDARYVLLPLVTFTLDGARPLSQPSPSVESIQTLQKYFEWCLRDALSRPLASEAASVQDQAINVVRSLSKASSAWAMAIHRRDARWTQRSQRDWGRQLKSVAELVGSIQQLTIDREG